MVVAQLVEWSLPTPNPLFESSYQHFLSTGNCVEKTGLKKIMAHIISMLVF